MADSTSTPSAANRNGSGIHKGMKFARFKAGATSPSVFSSKDMNMFPAVLEALLNFDVVIDQAIADASGNFTPTGSLEVSDQNTKLHLSLSPGQAGGGTVNVVLGRVTAEASEYVTVQPIEATGDGTYSDTAGSTFNVAKPFFLRGLTGPQIQPQYKDTTYFRIFSAQSPTGGTGVYVSGSDVGYQDCNVDARQPASFTAYYLSSYINYWLCSTNPNGTGTHIRVAKPYQVQNQISGETIYGQSFLYAYINNIHGNALYGIYRSSTRASDGQVEYQGVMPPPQIHYPVKYVGDGTTGLMVESLDVTDNPSDTYLGVAISTSTPIIFRDDSNAGMAWCAFNDQTYGH